MIQGLLHAANERLLGCFAEAPPFIDRTGNQLQIGTGKRNCEAFEPELGGRLLIVVGPFEVTFLCQMPSCRRVFGRVVAGLRALA